MDTCFPVVIRNFGSYFDDWSFGNFFQQYGNVIAAKVICWPDGSSKGFGYVMYCTFDDAQHAIENINKTSLAGMKLKAAFLCTCNYSLNYAENSDLMLEKSNNLHVKNIPESISEDELRRAFAPFGEILSVKIMTNNGKSRGFGFVLFKTITEAESALQILNKKQVFSDKPLFVSYYQSKEKRNRYLSGLHRSRELIDSSIIMKSKYHIMAQDLVEHIDADWGVFYEMLNVNQTYDASTYSEQSGGVSTDMDVDYSYNFPSQSDCADYHTDMSEMNEQSVCPETFVANQFSLQYQRPFNCFNETGISYNNLQTVIVPKVSLVNNENTFIQMNNENYDQTYSFVNPFLEFIPAAVSSGKFGVPHNAECNSTAQNKAILPYLNNPYISPNSKKFTDEKYFFTNCGSTNVFYPVQLIPCYNYGMICQQQYTMANRSW